MRTKEVVSTTLNVLGESKVKRQGLVGGSVAQYRARAAELITEEMQEEVKKCESKKHAGLRKCALVNLQRELITSSGHVGDPDVQQTLSLADFHHRYLLQWDRRIQGWAQYISERERAFETFISLMARLNELDDATVEKELEDPEITWVHEN